VRFSRIKARPGNRARGQKPDGKLAGKAREREREKERKRERERERESAIWRNMRGNASRCNVQ